MNDLDKVIRQLITILKNEKDETQRRRLVIVINELRAQAATLVDSGYLRPGYYQILLTVHINLRVVS